MTLLEQLRRYAPVCEQEERDRAKMLSFLEHGETPFSRANETAHFTASAWIVDRTRTKVLFVYHKIYDSWSWVGGHADGEADLAAVALREANEETGITSGRLVTGDILSLEIITVEAHIRKGKYVAPHLHLNLTYLVEADENEPLTLNEDETKGVRWFTFDEALKASNEPKMKDRIYKKLIEKAV